MLSGHSDEVIDVESECSKVVAGLMLCRAIVGLQTLADVWPACNFHQLVAPCG